MSNPTTLNREAWLTEFARLVAPIIEQRTGLKVPLSKIRLSCSFPRTRATPSRNGSVTIGQCFHGATHKSGLHELMINPIRDQVISTHTNREGKIVKRGIGETIIHEMIHASLPEDTMHKAPFAKAAKKMGLEGKPTETELGPEGEKIVQSIVDQIGQPYPHQAIDGVWGRKQGTRLIKVSCPDCGFINEQGNGYTTRITMSWIEVGLPTCPCGQQLEVTDKNVDTDVVALTPVDSSATYRVPTEDGKGFDTRFQIRRVTSEHFGERWTVIDFGAPVIRETTINGKVEKVEVPALDSTPRIVSAEDKYNALELVGFVREGVFTWDQIEEERNASFEDVDLGDVPEDDYAAEFEAGLFHDVDEDEDPDHPEDQTPERHVQRKRRNGEWVEVVTEFDYDTVAESRER